MNLFEIDARIQRCFMDGEEVIDTETGEIFDADYLTTLEMERNSKIRNIACWIKNLESDAEQLKAEKLKMAERQQRAEKKAESLKRYLASYLNGEKVKTAEFTVGYRASKSVVVDDESLLTDEYFKVKREVDKTAIKSAIALFGELPGAHIEEKSNISIK